MLAVVVTHHILTGVSSRDAAVRRCLYVKSSCQIAETRETMKSVNDLKIVGLFFRESFLVEHD